MKLVSGKLMAQIDKWTIENIGIPGAVLMENAGKGVFLKFLEKYSPSKDSSILIICGKGNNGGDGFVVARYLFNNGFNFDIVLLSNSASLKGDAKINYEICRNLGIKVVEITDEKSFFNILKDKKYNFIFDAILGTGLNSEVKGFYKNIIEYINQSNAIKIAIDIPSGLHSEKGIPLGIAVKANLTSTFAYKKIGVSTYPGSLFAGDVEVIDISIPYQQVPYKINYFEIDDELIKSFYKKRPIDGHKGTFGHVAILGGSVGFTGAPVLAAKGALYSGCGLVTSIVPENINSVVETLSAEAMSYPLNYKTYEKDKLVKFINSKNSIVVGPGFGITENTKKVFFDIIKEISIPIVIDADGLNILSEKCEILEKLKTDCIITPHPGEMARLINKSTKFVQDNRIDIAKEFSNKFNVVVVLKGYKTVIACNDEVFICPKGNSSLATGGTGDVLSGIIASFIAQGYSLKHAAIMGVYFHGFAGEIAEKQKCSETIIASDILENLHNAIKITLL